MATSFHHSLILFLGFLAFPFHECRWIFFDSSGHRIRHNRYWKIGYNEEEKDNDCIPMTKSLDNNVCRLKRCVTDTDCLTGGAKLFRCFCERFLCGRVCVPADVKCAQPLSLLNGAIKITFSRQPGVELFYRCNDGFKLVGKSKRTCQPNNLWSGSAPECVRDTFCGAPPVVTMADNDAESRRDKFVPGMTIMYRCRKGFINVGQSRMSICGDNGLWIGPQIKCKPIRCTFPRVLHGRVIHSGLSYNHTIFVICNRGYKIKCQKDTMCQFRTCQQNGAWSGSDPVCDRIHCHDLPHPTNGVMSIVSTPVERTAVFSCRSGYYLEGSRKRYCQRDGQWSGVDAKCKLLDCGLPPYVPEARVNYTNTIYGSTAAYSCFYKTGMLKNSMTLRCGSAGKWNPKPLSCVNNCNSIKIDKQAMNNHEEFASDTHCPLGYIKRRPIYPICFNNSWSHSGQCQPAPCLNKLPMRPNSQASYFSLEHGSIALYKCTFGYRKASGSNILRCNHGTWTGDPPTCKRSSCPRPVVPKNGMVFLIGTQGRWKYSVPSLRVQHLDVIEYECKSGYVLKGEPKAVCHYGEWRPHSTPHCIRNR